MLHGYIYVCGVHACLRVCMCVCVRSQFNMCFTKMLNASHSMRWDIWLEASVTGRPVGQRDRWYWSSQGRVVKAEIRIHLVQHVRVPNSKLGIHDYRSMSQKDFSSRERVLGHVMDAWFCVSDTRLLLHVVISSSSTLAVDGICMWYTRLHTHHV